ncbi:MAG: hypothetical protein WCX65_06880 [bacterium]
MDDVYKQTFSKRYGFQPENKEIVVREDAPNKFREALIIIAYKTGGFNPSVLRKIICNVLLCLPDDGNWSEYPNIDGEVKQLIMNCDWYKVYEVAESIYNYFLTCAIRGTLPSRPALFEKELNEVFLEQGIGWKMENGNIVMRGSESYEFAVEHAKTAMNEKSYLTANSEIEEAIKDISRRPEPDLTGAITHSMAALECVAREVSNEPNETLGSIMKNHRDKHGLPKTIEEAVTKLWGFSSEKARHIREGEQPKHVDAELVVGLSALITAYLCRNN